ncbi:hypothetical protein AKJ50_00795 [candidate division MSBL1 archaeon SCGC-AAA382A13]|uniref:Uncharacterized protein n=1 Tax=candidate division MSBL1 archaeon SCGC-AAA382A13 TaxID=1698279 RepID=A0A133VGC4_9EURY|nr:hypothetical protein AKJ50_00795 [candidate division MSBL1 archaeon SCGC-AAA382A13]
MITCQDKRIDRRSLDRSIANKGLGGGGFLFRKRFSSGAKKKASLDLLLSSAVTLQRFSTDLFLRVESWKRKILKN